MSSRSSADPQELIPARAPAETAIRKRPTQARGVATFNAILDATAQLLAEGSLEILNTNLVAEVAGVNIATLYQYFPSKEAILLELFRRETDQRMHASLQPVETAGASADWRDVLERAVDIALDYRRRQPGAAALRRAMRSMPELQVHERETMIFSAQVVAEALTRRAGISPQRAFLVGLCAVEAETALLDLWSLGYAGGMGYQDDRVIEEMKKLLRGYVETVLAGA